MVRNKIPRICMYFGSTERNSELRSLLQKGSEQNYERFSLFLSHRMEFRVVFSFAEGFGTEFQDFLSRGTTGIASEKNIFSVYSVFRGITFLLELLRFGTLTFRNLTFSDVTLSDINVVWCHVLSQYPSTPVDGCMLTFSPFWARLSFPAVPST